MGLYLFTGLLRNVHIVQCPSLARLHVTPLYSDEVDGSRNSNIILLFCQ